MTQIVFKGEDGGYFDQNPATAENGGSVLVAQFTMNGGFSFQGTVDYNDSSGGLSSDAFAVSVVPAPGAMLLLALAGLVGQNRRRT